MSSRKVCSELLKFVLCRVLTNFCLIVPAGASWLGRGLVKGGSYAGKAIQKGASTLRDHMTPREVPSEVSPKVSRGLNAAKDATGGAVKVSQFIGKALFPISVR